MKRAPAPVPVPTLNALMDRGDQEGFRVGLEVSKGSVTSADGSVYRALAVLSATSAKGKRIRVPVVDGDVGAAAERLLGALR